MLSSLALALALALGAGDRSDPLPVSAQASAPDDNGELLRWLDRAQGDDLQRALRAGYDRMLLEVRDYRGEQARELAELLHRRAQSTWSAMSLALISTRTGDSANATRVLRGAIKRSANERDRYELLERLGLALAGAGFDKASLAPLGSAFARGSANAGVVLGRIALSQGRSRQARAIFRTLQGAEPPQSWALRGWGLSMLPARPSTVSAPAN